MLNTGKKIRALRDKKYKYSNFRVVRKKNSERNKKPYPSPLQVKWSVPNQLINPGRVRQIINFICLA